MAQFINIHDVELTDRSAPQFPLGTTYLGDHKANRCGANVFYENLTYPLGGNCSGTAILGDGSTVPLTGTVAGNQAYVELDSACYQVEGSISVYVKWVSGSLETTLISFHGNVEITETGVVIQPSTPIPDLAQLMAQIEAMQEATAAANAAATKSVRYDTAQSLTDAQKLQARNNIGVGTGLVAYDSTQSLTAAQKAQARENIGAAQVSPTDFNGSGTGMFIEY